MKKVILIGLMNFLLGAQVSEASSDQSNYILVPSRDTSEPVVMTANSLFSSKRNNQDSQAGRYAGYACMALGVAGTAANLMIQPSEVNSYTAFYLQSVSAILYITGAYIAVRNGTHMCESRSASIRRLNQLNLQEMTV